MIHFLDYIEKILSVFPEDIVKIEVVSSALVQDFNYGTNAMVFTITKQPPSIDIEETIFLDKEGYISDKDILDLNKLLKGAFPSPTQDQSLILETLEEYTRTSDKVASDVKNLCALSGLKTITVNFSSGADDKGKEELEQVYVSSTGNVLGPNRGGQYSSDGQTSDDVIHAYTANQASLPGNPATRIPQIVKETQEIVSSRVAAVVQEQRADQTEQGLALQVKLTTKIFRSFLDSINELQSKQQIQVNNLPSIFNKEGIKLDFSTESTSRVRPDRLVVASGNRVLAVVSTRYGSSGRIIGEQGIRGLVEQLPENLLRVISQELLTKQMIEKTKQMIEKQKAVDPETGDPETTARIYEALYKDYDVKHSAVREELRKLMTNIQKGATAEEDPSQEKAPNQAA
jgi:hypothetical protein